MKLSTSGQEDERRAAWLLALAGSPPFRARLDAVAEAGSCRSAVRALGSALPAAKHRAAERSFERAAKRGFGVIALTEPDYPRLLRHIPDPPLALMIWGALGPEDALGVSVVGSRRATPYGLAASQRLSRELATRGLTIVSGLARGIDAAAHRGALEGGGRTIAVLGSGLSNLYPREHRRLAEAIVEHGAVISELDLDEPPLGTHFPRRNRVITGLTLGTLVVEAALKSGSLVSARLATDQNREVFAVPGPIGTETGEGVHALIRDGARLVSRAEDVLEELPDTLRDILKGRSADVRSASGSTTRPPKDPDESRVLGAIQRSSHRALDVDDILDAVSLSVDRVLAALTRLEVCGCIRRHPGGFFRIK